MSEITRIVLWVNSYVNWRGVLFNVAVTAATVFFLLFFQCVEHSQHNSATHGVTSNGVEWWLAE